MVFPHGDGDLYHKYRPLRFNEITGHKEIVKSIKKAISSDNPPQAFMLIGDSGTGKTTTARIMALSLNCTNKNKDLEPCLSCPSCQSIISKKCVDVLEVNAADHRGIDAIRGICSSMALMPMQVDKKVFILDESHQLTRDAQSSLLKELEEAPKHVFIILCTTDPGKVIKTVKNRCQRFTFNSLPKKEMVSLLQEVLTYETQDVPKEVPSLVADHAKGSPRQALVLLQQVLQLETDVIDDISRLLFSEEQTNANVFKLCNSLTAKNTNWSKVMSAYEDCKSLGMPAIGMILAGIFRNKVIKAKSYSSAKNYADVLELFVDPFPEGKVGENKLVLNLFKAYDLLKTIRSYK